MGLATPSQETFRDVTCETKGICAFTRRIGMHICVCIYKLDIYLYIYIYTNFGETPTTAPPPVDAKNPESSRESWALASAEGNQSRSIVLPQNPVPGKGLRAWRCAQRGLRQRDQLHRAVQAQHLCLCLRGGRQHEVLHLFSDLHSSQSIKAESTNARHAPADRGPSVFGSWKLDAAEAPHARRLLQVPESSLAVLNEREEYDRYRFRTQ